jgi:hypothetical protein
MTVVPITARVISPGEDSLAALALLLETRDLLRPVAETIAAADPIVADGAVPGAPLRAKASFDNCANPTEGGSYLNTEYTFFCGTRKFAKFRKVL